MKNRRVLVAMSGGVDSSVAALLLKKQGFDVIGVFMKFWSKSEKRENACCSIEAKKDARKVAEVLKIPLYTFNMVFPFKKKIVDSLIVDYKSGKTPNPCILCNKYIKFGEFLEKAKKLDCDYVATGHYALSKNGRLFRAFDNKKDQSYFLYNLDKNKLKQIIFPVAKYTKKQVREIAKKNHLPIFLKKESQDICFVPKNDHLLFLKDYIKSKSGKIFDLQKNYLGKHAGLYKYTLGQRSGLNIKNGQGPYYVVSKNQKNNTLLVSSSEKDLYSSKIRLKNIHWIARPKKFPFSAEVKIRYSQKGERAKIYKNQIIFNKKIRAITPGQHAVIYQGREVLGGGEIA